jgi:hypothetical protein
MSGVPCGAPQAHWRGMGSSEVTLHEQGHRDGYRAESSLVRVFRRPGRSGHRARRDYPTKESGSERG